MCKVVRGQPMMIIWTNLAVPPVPMLFTYDQCPGFLVSEELFLRVSITYGYNK